MHAQLTPLLTRDPRFAGCRPFSVSSFDIEAHISLPTIVLQVQRYGWNEPHPDGLFRPDVCYLDLALQRRTTNVQRAYFGTAPRSLYAPVGDCVFVPAGREVKAQNPAAHHRVFVCMFDHGMAAPYFDWEWSPFELEACFDIKNVNIRNGLARLAAEVMAPGFASNVLVESTVAGLIVELARHFKGVRAIASESGSKLSRRQLQSIQDRIEGATGPLPSMAVLAAECGISTRHLTRAYKNATGRTFSDYVADVRVRRAKELLMNPDALIKTVAYQCGFRSQASFASAFRRATGWTPRQFRRETACMRRH